MCRQPSFCQLRNGEIYVRYSQVADRERERIAKNVSRFAIVFPPSQTLSVPPAQGHWPKTTEGYAVSPVQYYIIVNVAKLNRQNLNGNFNP